MQFESWSAFWDMGGYGFFVWLAFGVTAAAMVAIVVDTLVAKRTLIKQVQQEQQRKQRIRSVQNSKTSSQ